MKNEFQETYDQIKVPKELKDNLLDKMKEPQQKMEAMQKMQKKSRFNIKWRYYTLAAAVLLCFIIFRLWGVNTVYKTPLRDGEYLSIVELQDGYLQFIESGSIITLTPNAGSVGKQEEETGEQEKEIISLEGGGSITIEKRQGKHIKRIQQQLLSNISGQEMILTVHDDEDVKIFEAEYEKDGVLYRISGDSVTQRQFIDFIIKQLKD